MEEVVLIPVLDLLLLRVRKPLQENFEIVVTKIVRKLFGENLPVRFPDNLLFPQIVEIQEGLVRREVFPDVILESDEGR